MPENSLCGSCGPCAQNHVIVEHDRHSGEIRGGTAKSVRHVDLGICGIKSDRLLCTGENHRFWTALNQIAETCGCISHGVCTMGDDKAIIAVIVFPDAPHHIHQCSGRMLVLSRFKSCIHFTSQILEMAGRWFNNCSEVNSGARPSSVTSEAMVPPVPINKIFFINSRLIPNPCGPAPPVRTGRPW